MRFGGWEEFLFRGEVWPIRRRLFRKWGESGVPGLMFHSTCDVRPGRLDAWAPWRSSCRPTLPFSHSFFFRRRDVGCFSCLHTCRHIQTCLISESICYLKAQCCKKMRSTNSGLLSTTQTLFSNNLWYFLLKVFNQFCCYFVSLKTSCCRYQMSTILLYQQLSWYFYVINHFVIIFFCTNLKISQKWLR